MPKDADQPWPDDVKAEDTYDSAVINEIRILLDYVTGSPVQTLKDLTIPDPAAPPPSGTAPPLRIGIAEVLNRLNALEVKTKRGEPLVITDQSFLQLLRDALGVIVRPATGLTIAYSAMVVGNRRGPHTQSRAVRAQQAYANLAAPAWRHRWAQRLLLGLALCVTTAAVWESARVALGRSLLQSAQALHKQQEEVSQEMTRLMEAGRQSFPADATVVGGFKLAGGPVLRLCDRPRVLAWQMRATHADQFRMDETHEATLFEQPAQQALCDRDTILAAQFRIAHAGLRQYMANWVSMISPGGSVLPRSGTPAAPSPTRSFPASANAAPVTEPTQADAPDVAENQMDVDFMLAPALLVRGNYLMPIIFALLGAMVYVILDFYSKLRDSLLAPRDLVLSWIRLVLGMVLGACVGLFFSGSNPAAVPVGAGLADSISLSASGLAFIAGFGVEGVFGMLDSLVRRIFSGDQDKGARLTPN